jgi:hypothetical protein
MSRHVWISGTTSDVRNDAEVSATASTFAAAVSNAARADGCFRFGDAETDGVDDSLLFDDADRFDDRVARDAIVLR